MLDIIEALSSFGILIIGLSPLIGTMIAFLTRDGSEDGVDMFIIVIVNVVILALLGTCLFIVNDFLLFILKG